ncbi:hypothetical protein CNMCM5793_006974 [Aspergillus hiratsukae]|uniref:Uncharacterized protein n=1 Tax=Aspergillus hiratsukae TaxID=1194566 RepID=A0A8H6PH82_9EURO|nr:hypothetical protein CNMCM5793_006974 [Aspergillus hiratsukae]
MQKGGWEGWAQVELANVFQTAYPQHAVLREQSVYVDGRKADITLTMEGEIYQVIELKCEAMWEDAYGDDKSQLLWLATWQSWVIGFSVVNQVTQAGIKYPWLAVWDVSYTQLTKPDRDGFALYVWWMHRDTAAWKKPHGPTALGKGLELEINGLAF